MSASVPARHWWSWGYTPFVVIGAAAIANTVMIVTSTQVRPQGVADNPYLDSQRFDAHKQAQVRFTEAGLTLNIAVLPTGAILSLHGAALATSGALPRSFTVAQYRPANAALDSVVPWPDTTVPLQLPLQPGPWRLTISTVPQEDPLQTMEVTRDIIVAASSVPANPVPTCTE